MSVLALEQAHLLQARSHIANASARIAQQCLVIARLRALGLDTAQAETTLSTMQKTLRVMREHKELIESELTAAAVIIPKRRATRPPAPSR